MADHLQRIDLARLNLPEKVFPVPAMPGLEVLLLLDRRLTLSDSLVHWRLPIPKESDTPLHNASDIEFITRAHVHARHSTSAEGFHCLYHLIDNITSVGRDASSQLFLLSGRLCILASGTFESDVETAIDAISFGHLTELGRDVFEDREVERSKVC